MHSYLFLWEDIYLKVLKDQIQNAQNRRSIEMTNCIFETYKNSVMPHGLYIYQTSSDMAMGKMYSYLPSHNEFPQWKFVLYCCANFPRIDLQSQELDNHHLNTCPMILFQVYHFIELFSVHGIIPLDENKCCCLCLYNPLFTPPTKLYTIK